MITTITNKNYTFKFVIDTNHIKINMTDKTLIESYEIIVKEEDIDKPLKEFYSMITRGLGNIRGLNKDNNHIKDIITYWIKYNALLIKKNNTDIVDIKESTKKSTDTNNACKKKGNKSCKKASKKASKKTVKKASKKASKMS